jgi:acyl-CoA thioesterase-2
MAATVAAGRVPHSVHAYYLRPAQNGETTSFAVARERDGRSFSTRHVTALQRGKNMFSAAAGFHDAPSVEASPRFQAERTPEVSAPDSRPPRPMGPLLLDVRTVESDGAGDPTRIWARSTDSLPDDPVAHLCLLAYFSDLSNGLFGTPLGGNNVITLDHVMWFHQPVSMTNWVLMELKPLAVAAGRGTYQGSLYDSAGRLVASFLQEMFGMVRTHNL